MVGYIKPYKPELKIKEYNLYRSVYCRLCKSLGKNFGPISRLTLSYDCTFLYILCLSLRDSCISIKPGHCLVNPLKKCSFYADDDEFGFISALSVILSYYKLKDNIKDNKFINKIRNSCLLPFFICSYRKASLQYPEINQIIIDFISQQDEVEKLSSGTIDQFSEPTANMLSRLLILISNNEVQQRILKEFGYFIGKWIYLMDAADDIDEDLKNGNFNPFVINLINNKKMDKDNIINYCNSILNQSLSRAIEAYNLLNIFHFKEILDNILNFGLPFMQKQRLFDKRRN